MNPRRGHVIFPAAPAPAPPSWVRDLAYAVLAFAVIGGLILLLLSGNRREERAAIAAWAAELARQRSSADSLAVVIRALDDPNPSALRYCVLALKGASHAR